MRAALLTAPNQIVLTEVPTPAAGSGEIVLRVRAATICGTDLRILRGKKTRGVRFPSVIGHEFAGEVVEVGKGVQEFKAGDRVSVDPVIPCHHCAYCQNGMENVCANRTAIGYEFDGAFAEYVRIPATAVAGGHVYKIGDGIAWEQAALAEPLGCCINGQEHARIGLGDVVVILGAGPIGLMHLQLARAAGARQIIVSEPLAHRREMAVKLGADRAVDPHEEDLQAVVKGITGGLGADAVIVAIGIPALANQALALVRKGGRVNLFAGFSAGDMPPMDVNLIHYNEIVVTGTSALTRRHYEKALRLIEAGVVKVKELVSHRFPLEQIHEAFQAAEGGLGIKVAIQP
ncbi:zinc-dependent dehydrogenase [Caldinitratiruptor microaerophilus]|uniref:Alcohol dehydrogenase n=1 Tax=Caldinitratiruptor microaerophilus TaxID=671077 RepID=A0AA35CKM2_9FIRM|nr:zinc-dependent dehydrogenase [Caldinitratiruptor microaerophilus]BDG60158.1 alcohol dehydrogenase [Caldinitratiruptor microaerophilus]